MWKTLIKLAVLVLVVKEIWLLLGIESVDNAIVSFLMAGELPGTKHVMSPDEVIRLVIALSVLLVLVVFRKPLFRLISWQPRTGQKQGQDQSVAEQVAAMPIEHPLGEGDLPPTEPVKVKKQKPKPILIIRRSTVLQRWVQQLQPLAMRVWMASRVQFVRLSALAVKYGHIAATYTAVQTRKWSVIAWQTARAYTILTIQYLCILWKRTEPHLRRFDGWLNHKLHDYEKTAFMLSLGSEMTATVQKWLDAAKTAASSKEPENK